MSLFDFFKKKATTKTEFVQSATAVKASEPRKGNVSARSIELSMDVINSIRKRFIAIDFETTGLSAYTDRIVEIGAVLFENGTATSQFETLVNPGMAIPESASKVNHITNDMVKNAPNERMAISNLVAFIGDAINGCCYFCAHNANFDSRFLVEALRRNGFDASLQFVDTLNAARKTIFGLNNYKQDTVALHFGIINNASHRAVSDAEVCGLIMVRLCDLGEEEMRKQANARQREIEISALTDDQKAWCAFIQKQIVQQGLDTDYLCFQGRSGNYLDCVYLYSFLRIKFGKGKRYVIAKKGSFKKNDFCTEPCVASEGGDEFLRVLFNSPFELESFMPYIIKEYVARQKLVRRDIREGYIKERNIPSYMEFATFFKNEELDHILASFQERIQQEQIEETARQEAKEKADEEKRLKKEQRELEKQRKAMEPKVPRTRPVIKLDDNGMILEEYDSISEAVEKTGINSKSIRDTANGVQKHAGGFCWKYKSDENVEKP